MNSAVMFSKASDEWATPIKTFLALDREFNFTLDAAAMRENALCPAYLGPDHDNVSCRDALQCDWSRQMGSRIATHAVWLNPPYSKCSAFIAKSSHEAQKGCTVVCLVPSRTDTAWWHNYIWNAAANRTYRGVEIRFIRGRLKFGSCENSAPFPSVVIVLRPHVTGLFSEATR